MLFLHALLFFLLGTFAVAIPAPGLGAVALGGDALRNIAKGKPTQLAGFWYKVDQVSEHHSFYLTWY